MAAAARIEKKLIGEVLSRKMDRTAVVVVEKLTRHAKYGKYIKRRVNYMAHDEKNSAQPGDRVLIVETRPLSKSKRWRIKEIIERAK